MSEYLAPVLAVFISAVLIYLSSYIRRCIYPAVEGQPPDWVFSIVWPVLYVLLAIAGYRIWKQKDTLSKGIFLTLLATLVIWPYANWNLCSPGTSMSVIILSLFLGVVLMVAFIRVDVSVTLLMIPFVLWIAYASLLNYRLVVEERRA